MTIISNLPVIFVPFMGLVFLAIAKVLYLFMFKKIRFFRYYGVNLIFFFFKS